MFEGAVCTEFTSLIQIEEFARIMMPFYTNIDFIIVFKEHFIDVFLLTAIAKFAEAILV